MGSSCSSQTNTARKRSGDKKSRNEAPAATSDRTTPTLRVVETANDSTSVSNSSGSNRRKSSTSTNGSAKRRSGNSQNSSNTSSILITNDNTPLLSGGDCVNPLPQFESPAVNPLGGMMVTSPIPSRQSSGGDGTALSFLSNSSASTYGSSSMQSESEIPRHLRRFFSDAGTSRTMSSMSTVRTNIYVPGDVPDLNMLPVASAVADFTDSETTSVQSVHTGETTSLATPLSKSMPDSVSAFTPVMAPSSASSVH